MTFKLGAFHTKNNWVGNSSNNFQIQDGMTVSEAMLSTGMGNIGLAFVNDICNVPDGKGGVVEVTVSDKQSLWLNQVPWTENGVQDLDRKVSWYNGLSNMQYANILDQLTDNYQLESVVHAGSRGEFIIFQFDMGDFDIDKDPNGGHSSMLTIAEDRSKGNKYFGTDITRLYCENQFSNVGKDMRAMPAGQDAALILDFQVRVEQSRIEQIKQLNDLFTKPVTKTAIKEVANALFAPPKPRRIVQDVQNAIANGYDMNSDDETTQRVSKKEKDAYRDHNAALVRHEKRVGEFNELFAQHEGELGANKYALWQSATYMMSHTEQFKSSQDRRELNRLFGSTQKALQDAWVVVNS